MYYEGPLFFSIPMRRLAEMIRQLRFVGKSLFDLLLGKCGSYPEIHLFEHCVFKVCFVEKSPVKVAFPKVSSAQVCFAEPYPCEIRPKECSST